LTEAVGYPIYFPKSLADLDRLYEKVKEYFPQVTTHTGILPFLDDDYARPRNAELVYDPIRWSDKRLGGDPKEGGQKTMRLIEKVIQVRA